MYAYDQQYVGPRPARVSGSATRRPVRPRTGRRGRAARGDVRQPVRGRARPRRTGRRRSRSPTPSSVAAPTSTRWSPRRWPSGVPATPSSGSIADARTALRGVTLDAAGHLRCRARPPIDRTRWACVSTIADRRWPSSRSSEDHKFSDRCPAVRVADVDASDRRSRRRWPRSARSTRQRVSVSISSPPPSSRPSPRSEAFNARALADRLTGRITLAIEDVEEPEYISSPAVADAGPTFAGPPTAATSPTHRHDRS